MTSERDIEQQLAAERPAPRAAYRGILRRHLVAIGTPSPRPANLGMLVAGFAAAGTLLLLAGALTIAGVGPLST